MCKHRQRKVWEKTNSSPTHPTMLRLMLYMQSVTPTSISTSKQPTGHTMDVTENLFYKCVLNISQIYVSVMYKHLDSLVCTKVTLTCGVASQPLHSRLQLSVCHKLEITTETCCQPRREHNRGLSSLRRVISLVSISWL